MAFSRIPGLKIFFVFPSESLIHPNVIPSILYWTKEPAGNSKLFFGRCDGNSKWLDFCKPLAIAGLNLHICIAFLFDIYGCLWRKSKFLNGAREGHLNQNRTLKSDGNNTPKFDLGQQRCVQLYTLKIKYSNDNLWHQHINIYRGLQCVSKRCSIF